MKTPFATTLLATLACQAYSADLITFQMGVQGLQVWAVPTDTSEGAPIVFRSPDEEGSVDDKWVFQQLEGTPEPEATLQHVESQKYIYCDPADAQIGCVLSDVGTAFTAYNVDQATGYSIIGLDIEGGPWVLEAGDTLHYAAPAEEVNAQWLTFNVVD